MRRNQLSLKRPGHPPLRIGSLVANIKLRVPKRLGLGFHPALHFADRCREVVKHLPNLTGSGPEESAGATARSTSITGFINLLLGGIEPRAKASSWPEVKMRRPKAYLRY